jgi:ParB/RepB/Spo0J family partition protein
MSEPTYEPAWPLDKLTPAPDNPRRDLGDLTELAKSISAVGIVEPLVVTTTATTVEDGHLLIVAGHRRLAAAQKAGLTAAPVMVHQGMDDLTRREIMLVENLQRSDLTPAEEARTYQGLIELGVSQHQLAERIGRSQPHISRRLALLALPDEIVARVGIVATGPKGKGNRTNSTGITMEDATELLKLKDHPDELAKVVKDAAAHGRLEGHVRVALNRIEGARNRERWTAEAKKKGWAIVKAVRYPEKPTYRKLLTGKPGWDYGADLIQIKATDHRVEPCHGLLLSEGSGERKEEVCTSPARHSAKGASHLKVAATRKAPDSYEQKRKEELKALKAAAARRVEVLEPYVTEQIRKMSSADALELLARAVLGSTPYSDAAVAADWLGVEKPPYYLALREMAIEAGDVVRYALAATLAHWHGRARQTASWGGSEEDLYTVLEKQGYELSPWEQEQLASVRTALQEDRETLEVEAAVEDLRARVIRNACLQTEDVDEQQAIAETLRDADEEFLEQALEQFPDPVDELGGDKDSATSPEPAEEQSPGLPAPARKTTARKSTARKSTAEGNGGDVAGLPQVTIRESGKKWITVCSGCREEIGRNTSEAFAEDMRRAHLEAVHGAVPAMANTEQETA